MHYRRFARADRLPPRSSKRAFKCRARGNTPTRNSWRRRRAAAARHRCGCRADLFPPGTGAADRGGGNTALAAWGNGPAVAALPAVARAWPMI